MREHFNYFILVFALVLTAIENHNEYKHIHTVSPRLTTSKPFVIGRPTAIDSGANILKTEAQLDIVLSGSFWTVYSFDIVCHTWCKKFADYSGPVKKEDDVKSAPFAAMTGIFGSVGKMRSLNITISTPVDTNNNDICAVIRPVYPTRYDNAPTINVKMTYRYKKADFMTIWFRCTACIVCTAFAIFHMLNYILACYLYPTAEKKIPGSKSVERRKREEQTVQGNDVDDAIGKAEHPGKIGLVQGKQSIENISDQNSNDSDYELIPDTKNVFAPKCK